MSDSNPDKKSGRLGGGCDDKRRILELEKKNKELEERNAELEGVVAEMHRCSGSDEFSGCSSFSFDSEASSEAQSNGFEQRRIHELKEKLEQMKNVDEANTDLKKRVSELEDKNKELENKVEGILKQMTDLERRNSDLKNAVTELQTKILDKDEEIAKLKTRVVESVKPPKSKPIIYHPKIEGKSLVFTHQQKGRGNDEFIFVCRIPEEPFMFFYLKKEEVEKMKDKLDLNKPITCKVSEFERHISSRTETEITEEYQVTLGEVFYICTGTLSQP